MANLHKIFETEKKRISEKLKDGSLTENITLYYNKRENSLQYKHEAGTLTILFDKKGKEDVEGCETFYYMPKEGTKDESGKGLGMTVQILREFGRHAEMPTRRSEGEIEPAIMLHCPESLYLMARRYQFDRKATGADMHYKGIKRFKENVKAKKSYDRD